MSEKFSNNNSDKKRIRQTNGAIFGCVGVFVFPVIATAFNQNEADANQLTLLSNADFVFSLFLIPLVFFGIYKLDRMIERKVPKDEILIADGENVFSKES